jgi:CDP-diacylglycerol--glycerol-3-phosphate 3-phosphatidyltransferase
MNLPNVLTLSRFFWTIVFIVLILQNSFASTVAAALVFALASVTDFLDGYLAQKTQQITDFGKIMDPIADKFLILAAFILFVALGVMQAWMVVLVFIREIAVTASRIVRLSRGQVIAAEKAGKIKTVFQIGCIGITLLFLILEKSSFSRDWSGSIENGWIALINILMFITVLLTVNSGASYFLNLRKTATA